MRISLLLQREPLGQIMEKTLACFWQSQYGQPCQVRWYANRPDLKAMRRRDEQAWLGNVYLNAFFTYDADQAVFDPIRREFARSVVGWRRPVQRAYVALATSQGSAPWLAQVGLGVTPAVPDSRHKLIVAGNHKIRLMDLQAGLAYGILKAGFGADFMQRELEARRQAEALGLPVPRLGHVAADGTWFSEQYLSGTPINRLADPQAAREAAITAASALLRLLTHTLADEGLDEYLARLHSHIQALIESNHLLSQLQKHQLMENTDTLVKQASDRRSAVGGRIVTALTHGDFQPANILVNGDGVWLIDWEYSARRQAGYDALVYMLQSRFPSGLTVRLRQMFDRAVPEEVLPLARWPGLDWQDVSRRRVHGLLFLLEELALHLEENANPCFRRPGEGLIAVQAQIPGTLRALAVV